ncbi:dephospho-CoA kinase [Arthrobacter sp. JZ12]|uniref:dephospho-CoA kinase n=1 Tax=Arthrobacter sp. JZ12 TaxID=2654190 RepID=UPI002B48BFB9|nr:dephospho-CoA kinase [Arthrobacter sp. JZ12]WRH24881.1 dephospho-CoA kinase [Arthrobacter sp. JZ12]
MLRVGLTGGIAAGKSLAARALQEAGAVLIDADRLARVVVEPGSEGLREVAAAFGPGVLQEDGSLNRPALGARIFSDPGSRETLNAIIHPRVRRLAAEAEAAAASGSAGAVVVHDIPLLVETGQEETFHLVLVVDAPEDQRVQRMVVHRGMSEQDALSRIRAQADPAARRAAADVVLDNSGAPGDLVDAVRRLWKDRLVPFARNIELGRVAERSGGPVLVENPDWPREADLLGRRLKRLDPRVVSVQHVGSTAVGGLPAKDVLDLQLTVRSLDDADALCDLLTAAGFPRLPGTWQDTPTPEAPDPELWQKRLHCNADPGRAVNLHVRAAGSPGWVYALAFRDWLRANPDMVQAYLTEKVRCAQEHQGDFTIAGYAAAKEAWFTQFAAPRLSAWKNDVGWSPEQAAEQ